MLPRPRFRLPLWSAVIVVVAAYLIRSFIRDSLRPDIPLDLVVLAMLMAVIAIVGFVRKDARTDSDPVDDAGIVAQDRGVEADLAGDNPPGPSRH